MLNFEELYTIIITACASVSGSWLSFRQMYLKNKVETEATTSQLEIIDYLNEVKKVAVENEQKAKILADKVVEENQQLKAKVSELTDENKSVKLQVKILNEIVGTLQASLAETKRILENQMTVNEELLQQINNCTNHRE